MFYHRATIFRTKHLFLANIFLCMRFCSPSHSLSVSATITVTLTLTIKVLLSAIVIDTFTIIVTHAYSDTHIVIGKRLMCLIVVVTVTMRPTEAVPSKNYQVPNFPKIILFKKKKFFHRTTISRTKHFWRKCFCV